MNGYWASPKVFYVQDPKECCSATLSVRKVLGEYDPTLLIKYHFSLMEGCQLFHQLTGAGVRYLVPASAGFIPEGSNSRGQAAPDHDEKTGPAGVVGPLREINRELAGDGPGGPIAYELDHRDRRWHLFSVVSLNGFLYADLGLPVGVPSAP